MTDDPTHFPDVPDCSRLLQNLPGASIFRPVLHLEHPGTCEVVKRPTMSGFVCALLHHPQTYHVPIFRLSLCLQKFGANLRHHDHLTKSHFKILGVNPFPPSYVSDNDPPAW